MTGGVTLVGILSLAFSLSFYFPSTSSTFSPKPQYPLPSVSKLTLALVRGLASLLLTTPFLGLSAIKVEQPSKSREMQMIMIPKPGKDISKVKGWRPIILANTVGKLTEKLVAEELQNHETLWHPLSFAGRKAQEMPKSVKVGVL